MAPPKGMFKGRMRAIGGEGLYPRYRGRLIAKGGWLPAEARDYRLYEISQVPDDERRPGGKTHVTTVVTVRPGMTRNEIERELARLREKILARTSP